MSMPDKWEYPWFAAWDLAFHCVALAHVDPAFAKYQLILLCREWFQHPQRGAARLRVGLRRRQPAGAGLGGAGGLRHRRRPRPRLPEPGLRQAAGQLHLVGQPGGRRAATTCSRAASWAWTTSARSTAPTCPSAAPWSSPTPPAGWASTRSPWRTIAAVLNRSGSGRRQDLVLKFLEHFARHPRRRWTSQGLWDEADGLLLRPAGHPVGHTVPVQGPLDGRDHPGAGGRGHRRRHAADTRSTWASSSRGSCSIRASRTCRSWPRPRSCAASRAGQRLLLSAGLARPAGAAARQALRRGRVPVPARPAGAVGLPPRHPYVFDVEGVQASIDYEPGRVDHGHVRRQLQLARPDLVPAQLPAVTSWSATTGSSATTSRSSTRPGRASSSPWTRSPPTCRTG